ncbi:MAG: uracil-DNA glycosylase family protein [Bacteroidales bacterium]|nr:uracil-DNA glycosylase family protein [Bacteroidales bacterium]
MDVIEHPLKPFIPEGARLLVLGSFPPPQVRWSMDFFYPNFINDFWRICGIVFFSDKDHFIAEDNGKKLKKFDRERIIAFCRGKGIALYDTASAVRRLKGNASDKFLEVARPTDIVALLAQMPDCKAIAVTGQKALETFIEANRPIADGMLLNVKNIKIGEPVDILLASRTVKFFRMPSTSRAYPLSLEKKAECYRKLFAYV